MNTYIHFSSSARYIKEEENIDNYVEVHETESTNGEDSDALDIDPFKPEYEDVEEQLNEVHNAEDSHDFESEQNDRTRTAR